MNEPVTQAEQQIFATDLALAQAVRARDRKATARFVDLHGDRVHGYVRRRLAPKIEMVDDLVQEVFLASWRALPSYSGHSPLEAWVLAIARNKVEDYYRRALSRPLTDLEDAEDSPALAEQVDFEAALDQIRDAKKAARIIEELPHEYGLALRWRYWEGQSARAMAVASGRSEKAVERLLARARERFKIRWRELAAAGGGTE